MGLSFIETIALHTIRGLLNGHIGQYTPYDLRKAIEEDRNLWIAMDENMKGKIRGLKTQFQSHFDKFFGQIHTALLLDWLQMDQPHLWTVIMSSEKNYNWFDKQVNQFLREIEKC